MVKRGKHIFNIFNLNKKIINRIINYQNAGTVSRRGRKCTSIPAVSPAGKSMNSMLQEPSPVITTTPVQAPILRRCRGAFQGRLSHTSPILSSPTISNEMKITVFFATVKSEDVPDADNEIEIIEEVPGAKVGALHKVFGKSKGKFF